MVGGEQRVAGEDDVSIALPNRVKCKPAPGAKSHVSPLAYTPAATSVQKVKLVYTQFGDRRCHTTLLSR